MLKTKGALNTLSKRLKTKRGRARVVRSEYSSVYEKGIKKTETCQSRLPKIQFLI